MANMFPEQARKTEIQGITVLYWNTQRMYTPGGQRIVATNVKATIIPGRGGVLFFDLDRHIEGFIPDCDLNEAVIMSAYDHNNYNPITTQDEYAVLKDLFAIKEELIKLF